MSTQRPSWLDSHCYNSPLQPGCSTHAPYGLARGAGLAVHPAAFVTAGGAGRNPRAPPLPGSRRHFRWQATPPRAGVDRGSMSATFRKAAKAGQREHRERGQVRPGSGPQGSGWGQGSGPRGLGSGAGDPGPQGSGVGWGAGDSGRTPCSARSWGRGSAWGCWRRRRTTSSAPSECWVRVRTRGAAAGRVAA